MTTALIGSVLLVPRHNEALTSTGDRDRCLQFPPMMGTGGYTITTRQALAFTAAATAATAATVATTVMERYQGSVFINDILSVYPELRRNR